MIVAIASRHYMHGSYLQVHAYSSHLIQLVTAIKSQVSIALVWKASMKRKRAQQMGRRLHPSKRSKVRTYTWDRRLESKTAFGKCISTLVKDEDWVQALHLAPTNSIQIEEGLQKDILEGFRKFYPRWHLKRSAIDAAICVEIHQTYMWGKHNYVFVLKDENGNETTVQKGCSPSKFKHNLAQACRGSVHNGQIKPFRNKYGHVIFGQDKDDVDHCNPGGFKALVKEWSSKYSQRELNNHLVRNDPRSDDAAKGFWTFKPSPILNSWLTFHLEHAELQCLSKEAHKAITRTRIHEG